MIEPVVLLVGLAQFWAQLNNYGIDSEKYPHLKNVRVRREIDSQLYGVHNRVHNAETKTDSVILKTIFKNFDRNRENRQTYSYNSDSNVNSYNNVIDNEEPKLAPYPIGSPYYTPPVTANKNSRNRSIMPNIVETTYNSYNRNYNNGYGNNNSYTNMGYDNNGYNNHNRYNSNIGYEQNNSYNSSSNNSYSYNNNHGNDNEEPKLAPYPPNSPYYTPPRDTNIKNRNAFKKQNIVQINYNNGYNNSAYGYKYNNIPNNGYNTYNSLINSNRTNNVTNNFNMSNIVDDTMYNKSKIQITAVFGAGCPEFLHGFTIGDYKVCVEVNDDF